ncbi:hypothetical protein K402DRAFT_410302 [Aulographum hederae CBS 113979]|uniref:NAD-dependent epimerase/dehydratase domain-containing protein n=1 Tax=Aulographum hederae CBS 113979 TaxID=1176131 RepID=A0A6G1HAW7_9PEZI|nr:hypothetical protein K402DRAFT_410302 [Aulographum hederae CBS 113979]
MHVILTGATGLVGAGALGQLLAQPAVIQMDDFTTYSPEVLEQLKGAEACIWAQGISVTQVSKEREAETSLLSLPTTYPSLRPYSVRPGGVDHKGDGFTTQALEHRTQTAMMKMIPYILPPMRLLYSQGLSPTKDLGKFLVDLAVGDGKEVEGPNVEKGRIVNNKAFRRMVGL